MPYIAFFKAAVYTERVHLEKNNHMLVKIFAYVYCAQNKSRSTMAVSTFSNAVVLLAIWTLSRTWSMLFTVRREMVN